MPSGDTFADRLTRSMREQHLTTLKLHELLGGVVSVRTITRWRSGRAAPGVEALPFVARALNTTPNQLVGWEDA